MFGYNNIAICSRLSAVEHKIDKGKYAVVHKDYVLDFTNPQLQNVIMETESGDGGF